MKGFALGVLRSAVIGALVGAVVGLLVAVAHAAKPETKAQVIAWEKSYVVYSKEAMTRDGIRLDAMLCDFNPKLGDYECSVEITHAGKVLCGAFDFRVDGVGDPRRPGIRENCAGAPRPEAGKVYLAYAPQPKRGTNLLTA